MVKTITFIKRKPGMSVDDFGQYWRKQHAAIVTKLPGLRRYVQCHTIPSGYRNGEPAYDGVAEVWFDSTDAMRETARYSAVFAPTSRISSTSRKSISSSPRSGCRRTRRPIRRWCIW